MDFLSSMWMQGLIHTYGLWVLFAMVMSDSIGIPVPGETAVVTAAVYAGTTHHFNLTALVLVAATAAIIGDNIGYLIGRTVGIRSLGRYGGYIRLNGPRLKLGQYLFLEHVGKFVFFGRFIALLRTYAVLLAGANRMIPPPILKPA